MGFGELGLDKTLFGGERKKEEVIRA